MRRLLQPTTACGLGDIIVRGRYYVLDERGWFPRSRSARTSRRPPPARRRVSARDGPTKGVGVEVSRTIGRGLMAMVDGGYTFIGDPGFDLNNTWWYDVGLGQNLAKDVVNVSVFVEEYRALVQGLANSRELVTAVSCEECERLADAVLRLAGVVGRRARSRLHASEPAGGSERTDDTRRRSRRTSVASFDGVARR